MQATCIDRVRVSADTSSAGIAALLERLGESERRFEAALAEQDRRLAECLELVRRMPGGRA